MFFTRNMTAH